MAPQVTSGCRTRLRRVHKPEAERRRRARITLAVERLRLLLMEEGAHPPPPAPCTPPHLHHLTYTHRRGVWQRLEKVVVLELTVAHLRRLASQQPAPHAVDSGRQQFREGYLRCQEEVMRFLGRTAAVQPHLAARLKRHFHLSADTVAQDSCIHGGCISTSVGCVRGVPAPRVPNCASPEYHRTDLSHHTTGEQLSPPRAASQGVSGPAAEVPLGAGSPGTASRRTSASHVHWKKSLRSPARACFWRPWSPR